MDAGHPSGLFGGSPSGSALVVHAGAWAIPTAERDAHMEGCRRAIDAGWRVLLGGGSALEAVVVAVGVMEDDPALNAGTGSVLCAGGWAEMDAGLMDGGALEAGAVASVREARNPILLAREVLRSDHVLLVGEGAARFGEERGIPRYDPARLVTPREVERLAAWRAGRAPPSPPDTVGAVAVDRSGRLAAGASTGGMVGKRSGRVGDTPIAGCGYFADDRLAAASCTGEGEAIVRIGLARRAAELARDASAQDAAWLAVREMEDRVSGRGGLILVARDGSLGWAFNTPAMALGYLDSETPDPVVRV
jgi:beta-aspartyl-peptidase (threonine type)